MIINNNTWNRIRYTLYTPFYNVITGLFAASRKRSVALLAPKPADRILLIGAGTGLDLDFLPKNTKITATDITPAMVAKARQRAQKLQLTAEVLVMDGQQLAFPAASFDKVILHLIVAVIPDPAKCLQETERVLKPGGEAVIFDKFLQKNEKPTLLRRLFNQLTNIFFSNINRNIEALVKQTNLQIVHNEPANFNGNFRILKLKKH